MERRCVCEKDTKHQRAERKVERNLEEENKLSNERVTKRPHHERVERRERDKQRVEAPL